MDFAWSTEQTKFYDEVYRFAKEELVDDVCERDFRGDFARELWLKCAAFGIHGLTIDPRYGGRRDVDFMTAMLAMEALGYGCNDNGLTFALNAQLWTVQRPIAEFGSDDQKERYLPAMCRGELVGCHALTEQESGSDAFNIQTTARQAAGGYVLTGRKRYISLGPIADVALIFASIDPSLGKWGVTAFLVDTDTPGCTRGQSQHKMGLRTVPFGELVFEDCRIPESSRLGPEGAGVSLSTSSLEWERCCILASQLGAMQRQLETAIDYVKSRRQFGQPIGKFQSVSNRIAEMRLRLETSRLLLYKVAWLKQRGEAAMLEAAMLKLHLSECFAESSFDAIRIHGGAGYVSENGIERDLRDAIGGTLYAGTSDIQRNIIAAMLGL